MIGAGTWYFTSWRWALLPLALAVLVVCQSVSATLTARQLEEWKRCGVTRSAHPSRGWKVCHQNERFTS
jgi:hypothetical protein